MKFSNSKVLVCIYSLQSKIMLCTMTSMYQSNVTKISMNYFLLFHLGLNSYTKSVLLRSSVCVCKNSGTNNKICKNWSLVYEFGCVRIGLCTKCFAEFLMQYDNYAVHCVFKYTNLHRVCLLGNRLHDKIL